MYLVRVFAHDVRPRERIVISFESLQTTGEMENYLLVESQDDDTPLLPIDGRRRKNIERS